MHIKFLPLSEAHFPLMLKWLDAPHVKVWWDQDITWTLELIQEKYSSYVKEYKIVDGKTKPIHAYIICLDNQPVGYIQLYNAYDFPRSKKLIGLSESLGAFDIFIGEEVCLKKGIGSQAIAQFLAKYCCNYSYIFADPARDNIAAIRAYEKAGFKKISEQLDTQEVWMLWDSLSLNAHKEWMDQSASSSNHTHILEELKAREPIFHHPDKFGRTKQDILDMTCDEFWEVDASGNVYTREYIINTLLQRYANSEYKDVWEAKNFELTQQIAPNNYLVAYVLIQEKRITRRATIWRHIDGNWKILYHQGTVIQ